MSWENDTKHKAALDVKLGTQEVSPLNLNLAQFSYRLTLQNSDSEYHVRIMAKKTRWNQPATTHKEESEEERATAEANQREEMIRFLDTAARHRSRVTMPTKICSAAWARLSFFTEAGSYRRRIHHT